MKCASMWREMSQNVCLCSDMSQNMFHAQGDVIKYFLMLREM